MGGEISKSALIAGTFWKNKKNGRQYEVIGIVKDANNGNENTESEILYQDIENGSYYHRKLIEFVEKFI